MNKDVFLKNKDVIPYIIVITYVLGTDECSTLKKQLIILEDFAYIFVAIRNCGRIEIYTSNT